MNKPTFTKRLAITAGAATLALATLGYVGATQLASAKPVARSAAVSKDASTSISPLARAENSLTSEWVHFCFNSRAVEGIDSTQLKGCGSQNYAVHEATANLTSAVTLAGKSQSEKVVVSRIGSKEWIYYHNKWSVTNISSFPAASPGAIASLLRATPTVKKVGVAWVAGQSTTRYRGVFTAADLASHKKSLTPSMVAGLAGLKSDAWTAYLNHAGQIVEVSQNETTTSSATKSITRTDQFSRYGTPGKVLAPGPSYQSPPKIGSKS